MPLNADATPLRRVAALLLAACFGLPGASIAAAPPLANAAQTMAGDDLPPPPTPPRYDMVGYAAVLSADSGQAPAISATHASLPVGSFIELTALDNGKTIIVIIADGLRPRDGWLLNLSAGAAQLLGSNGGGAIGVRARRLDPPGIDQASLRNGGTATERIDAPPVLLRALRKKLPAPPSTANVSNPRPRPARAAAGVAYPVPGRITVAPPPSTTRPGTYVQIAALSSAERATALAQSLGGSVLASGGIYRVRIGPYADPASAERARADIAQRGYGDARIVRD